MAEQKIGLALSGGGFRAAAFHLGTLRKLNELGILSRINVISVVSGGAILGAYYCLNKHLFNKFSDFDNEVKNKLKTNIVFKVLQDYRILANLIILLSCLAVVIMGIFYYRSLAGELILAYIILLLLYFFFLYKIVSFTEIISKIYSRIFYGDKLMANLPDEPLLAINTSNLETGSQMTFSKKLISDTGYRNVEGVGRDILLDHKLFPISLAVACSTAVPFAFDPPKIKKEFFISQSYYNKVHISLVDGGVYDNQGIHKLVQRSSEIYGCTDIICSDASAYFKIGFWGINPYTVLMRASNIMMRRIKNLQKIHDIYERPPGNINNVVYFSLDLSYIQCIEEFLVNAQKGLVKNDIILKLGLDKEKLKKYKPKVIDEIYNELVGKVKNAIGYDDIIKSGPDVKYLKELRAIKTHLSGLSDDEVNKLSGYASALTELQIKLYYPDLLI